MTGGEVERFIVRVPTSGAAGLSGAGSPVPGSDRPRSDSDMRLALPEVERITDPATIRNIDWADHYETTTPRGATPMFDAAQDLSEREADANALEAYRAMVAQMEAAYAEERAYFKEGAGHDEREIARLNAALEQAEARVDQLTDLLTLRTEALNRTGAHNDQLRATIARVEKIAARWDTTSGVAMFWPGSAAEVIRDALEEPS